MTKNNEWTLLNSEGFNTGRDARRFINIMSNQHYGLKEISKSIPVEFRVVESKGKFYIEYKLTENHTL